MISKVLKFQPISFMRLYQSLLRLSLADGIGREVLADLLGGFSLKLYVYGLQYDIVAGNTYHVSSPRLIIVSETDVHFVWFKEAFSPSVILLPVLCCIAVLYTPKESSSI
jgi:hypothetical protein